MLVFQLKLSAKSFEACLSRINSVGAYFKLVARMQIKLLLNLNNVTHSRIYTYHTHAKLFNYTQRNHSMSRDPQFSYSMHTIYYLMLYYYQIYKFIMNTHYQNCKPFLLSNASFYSTFCTLYIYTYSTYLLYLSTYLLTYLPVCHARNIQPKQKAQTKAQVKADTLTEDTKMINKQLQS